MQLIRLTAAVTHFARSPRSRSTSTKLCLALLVLSSCSSGSERPARDGSLGSQSDIAAVSDPNRPSRLLIEDTFDSGTVNTLWNDVTFRSELYPPGQALLRPVDGQGLVLQQYIPKGMDEVTSAQVGLYGAEAFTAVTGASEVEEFLVEWEEYYPEGHDFANGSQKMLRFIGDERDGRQGPQVNLVQLYNSTLLQLVFYDPVGSGGVPVDRAVERTLSIPTGTWLRFVVWCRLNTPGERDGFGRVYLNGQEILSLENASLRGDNTRGWDVMWIGGNHTNQGLTENASYRYIDNIRWYGR